MQIAVSESDPGWENGAFWDKNSSLLKFLSSVATLRFKKSYWRKIEAQEAANSRKAKTLELFCTKSNRIFIDFQVFSLRNEKDSKSGRQDLNLKRPATKPPQTAAKLLLAFSSLR